MADLNLNLGDANAINGSLNVTNNVVERNKSRDEIVLEQENKYRLQCREFLADGKISAEERAILDKSGAELGIDKARQQQILKSEIEICKTKSLTLDKSSSVLFLQFVKKLKAYDVQGMLKLYPRLQIMEAGFEDSMVKFYYFLLTSLVRPTECVSRYESHKEDNYWLTYWTVLAYAMKGLPNKSEQAKKHLSSWKEYDEENSLLLDIAISIIENDWDLAEAYRDVLDGNYSEELASFASTIFTLINNKDDLGNIAYDPEQMIYIDGFFYRQTTRLGLGVLNTEGILIQEDADESQRKTISKNSLPTTTWSHKITPVPTTPANSSFCSTATIAKWICEGYKYEWLNDDIIILTTTRDYKKKLWSSKNQQLLDFECIDINKVTPDLIAIQQYIDQGSQWIFYRLSSNSVLEQTCDNFDTYQNYLIINTNLRDASGQYRGKSWGVYDMEKDDLCVPIKYEALENKGEDGLRFWNIDGTKTYYVLDHPLNRVYEYEDIWNYGDGVTGVYNGSLWAIFCIGNPNNESATDYIFDKIYGFDDTEQLIGVMRDGLFGIWDGKNGRYILEPLFLDPSDANNFCWDGEEGNIQFEGEVLTLRTPDGDAFYFNIKTLKYE